MTRDELLQAVLDCGATKATYIPQEKIVVSAHFRDICATNSCGGYGRYWVCPPDNGDIEELMEKVWGYDYYGDLRAVDVAMRRLREKLEEDPANPKYFITKRGAGYYLQK